MAKTKKPINTNKLILNEIINNTFARHKEILQELDLSSFDGNITLQDYQIKALENALIALKLFYQSGADDLLHYYRKETRNITEQNINRASFWMATGSGKSIVMIKLIACLDTLFKRGVFIKRPIMLLAPNDKILSQFKAHIQQYNTFAQKQIIIKELKEFESNANHLFSDTEILLYIARSDLLESIENVGKDSNAKRLYYKNYLNKEGWYILLDEAHKGDSKDSIRKSYYNELAKGLKEDGKQESRKGFIFNFSATFSDAIDKDTCAFNYNLERFNSDGYGKNIAVLDSNLKAFKDLNNPQAKINHILESFIVFYAIKKAKKELFKKAEALSIRLQYHNPLIIAVSDKVNTKDAGIKLYFEAILQVLGNKITQDELRALANNLCNKLRQEQIYFGNESFSQSFLDLIQHVSLDELRLSIFYAKQVSSCEACRIKGNAKELVFKSKNSSKPFLLLNIGNAKEWEKEYIINLGIEIGEDLGKSYFEEINNEDCPINIMIGSKVFSEGWDSNRVNLISFINIGSINAKKYVLQTIGRGVRIEPIANERKRLNIYDKERLKAYNEGLETLFIMASDENAIKIILEQMQDFISKERLKGFKKVAISSPY